MWLALAGIAPAAPHITIDQPVVYFGSVTNAVRLTHDFVIRNEGDAELEISRVVSGCDACLRAVLEKPRILPGEETILHSQLDLRLLSGNLSRSITIDSNDPDRARVTVILEGTVVPLYRITPTEINLSGFPSQRTETLEITPLQALHSPLSAVTCDNTNVVAKMSALDSDRFQLAVEVLDSLPRGQSTVNVTIRSVDPRDPPCVVMGNLYYPPDFEILPARLIFAAKDEPQLRILWLKQHGSNPLTLLDAVPPSDEFRCEIDPDPVSADYRIYITASHVGKLTGQTQQLILKMVDSSQKEKSMPVAMVVGDVRQPLK